MAAGAEVNAQNTDGHTALMFAYNGKTQVRRQRHQDRPTTQQRSCDIAVSRCVILLAQLWVSVLLQVASLLDKYGEYIQEENDNNTKIIREALQTHAQVSPLSDPSTAFSETMSHALPRDFSLPRPRIPLKSNSPCVNHGVWQVVDLLMSNGADAALTDKEGHTAADFDYKPPSKDEAIADKAKDAVKEEL